MMSDGRALSALQPASHPCESSTNNQHFSGLGTGVEEQS